MDRRLFPEVSRLIFAIIERFHGEAAKKEERLSTAPIRLAWAEDALRCVRSGEAAGSMDMEMQVMRLADTALVETTAGELLDSVS